MPRPSKKLAGKRFSGQHRFDNVAQFAYVLAALFSQVHVAFELPGIARRTHQMPNCLNRSDALVGGVEEARHFDGGARFDNEDLRKLSAS